MVVVGGFFIDNRLVRIHLIVEMICEPPIISPGLATVVIVNMFNLVLAFDCELHGPHQHLDLLRSILACRTHGHFVAHLS